MENSKQYSTVQTVIDEVIQSKIFLIRNQKVMLDVDLAHLYGVETKVLNQAVKRNIQRFPLDFMFALSKEEENNLKSQIVTSSSKTLINQSLNTNLKSQFVTSSYGGRRKALFVFTEQGVAMLSSVLRSDKAIQVNIQIMRTFIKLRESLSTHKELKEKLENLEEKYDSQFDFIFEFIQRLTEEDLGSKTEIGFRVD